MEALRLSEPVVQRLHDFGIRRIEQLAALPRADLPSRFGPTLLLRLDQALGRAPEVLLPERPAEPVQAEWSFEVPINDRHVLEGVLRRLLEQIVGKLTPRHEGVQQLLCRVQGSEAGHRLAAGSPLNVTINLVQPTASVSYLEELLRLQLERTPLPREIAAVVVRAGVTALLESRQQEIFESGERDGSKQLVLLVERLSSRLGLRSVVRPHLHPDAQPELACRYQPWVEKPFTFHRKPEDAAEKSRRFKIRKGTTVGSGTQNSKFAARGPLLFNAACPRILNFECLTPFSAASSGLRLNGPALPHLAPVLFRPLRLRPQPVAVEAVSVVPDGPPVRFRWQGCDHRVACSWGPERIETGWWRGRLVRRDYYRVETTAGHRFWLFREIDAGAWFVHGEFE